MQSILTNQISETLHDMQQFILSHRFDYYPFFWLAIEIFFLNGNSHISIEVQLVLLGMNVK